MSFQVVTIDSARSCETLIEDVDRYLLELARLIAAQKQELDWGRENVILDNDGEVEELEDVHGCDINNIFRDLRSYVEIGSNRISIVQSDTDFPDRDSYRRIYDLVERWLAPLSGHACSIGAVLPSLSEDTAADELQGVSPYVMSRKGEAITLTTMLDRLLRDLGNLELVDGLKDSCLSGLLEQGFISDRSARDQVAKGLLTSLSLVQKQEWHVLNPGAKLPDHDDLRSYSLPGANYHRGPVMVLALPCEGFNASGELSGVVLIQLVRSWTRLDLDGEHCIQHFEREKEIIVDKGIEGISLSDLKDIAAEYILSGGKIEDIAGSPYEYDEDY